MWSLRLAEAGFDLSVNVSASCARIGPEGSAAVPRCQSSPWRVSRPKNHFVGLVSLCL